MVDAVLEHRGLVGVLLLPRGVGRLPLVVPDRGWVEAGSSASGEPRFLVSTAADTSSGNAKQGTRTGSTRNRFP